jgi:hypothetical protein
MAGNEKHTSLLSNCHSDFLHFIFAQLSHFVQKQILLNEQNLTKVPKSKWFIGRVNFIEQSGQIQNDFFCLLSLITIYFGWCPVCWTNLFFLCRPGANVIKLFLSVI